MRANTLEEVGILRENNDNDDEEVDSSSKSQSSSVKMNKINSHVKEEYVSFITLQSAHKTENHHP